MYSECQRNVTVLYARLDQLLNMRLALLWHLSETQILFIRVKPDEHILSFAKRHISNIWAGDHVLLTWAGMWQVCLYPPGSEEQTQLKWNLKFLFHPPLFMLRQIHALTRLLSFSHDGHTLCHEHFLSPSSCELQFHFLKRLRFYQRLFKVCVSITYKLSKSFWEGGQNFMQT